MDNIQSFKMEQKLDSILELVNILVPTTFTLPYISQLTNTQRDTIYKYLTRNYIDGMDFYKKDGKILINRDVGLELVRKYNANNKKTNIQTV